MIAIIPIISVLFLMQPSFAFSPSSFSLGADEVASLSHAEAQQLDQYLQAQLDTPLAMKVPQTALLQRKSVVPKVIKKTAYANNLEYVSLLRFAAQQLYAPKRLVHQRADIHRVPILKFKPLRLLQDHRVSVSPLASWRGIYFTVTALTLVNKLNHDQELSLDAQASSWCGDWRAAVLYPRNHLAAVGLEGDSTSLFLISASSFNQAIKGCGH